MESWNPEKDGINPLVKYLCNYTTADGKKPLICVDFFDTVVTRKVEPEYTKEISSQLLSRIVGGTVSGQQLYEYRQDIEREIVENNGTASGELEFSLVDFSEKFYSFLKNQYPQIEIGDKKSFTQILLNIEVAVELAVQRVCPQMFEVLTALKQAGFSLVLVSDFYLPGSHFGSFLKPHGLEQLFENLCVSIDYGQSKGSGKLYEKISHDLHCPTKNMVMIGDNEHADIKMARENGIKTILVSRPEQRLFYETFRKKIANNERWQQKLFSQLNFTGEFCEMASSFWLFCHRLFEDVIEKKVGDVFFLSKEGEFLKKLFDRYQLDLYGQLRVRSHYLLASRKATFLASLESLDEEDFLRLLAHYRDISIRDFLQSLNFDKTLVDTLCEQLSGSYDELIVDFKSSEAFSELLDLPLFRDQYEEQRLEQRNNFKQYLHSFGVNCNEDGLFLVDVGWKGSIQDNIFYILEQKIAVQGYFIGSFNPTEIKEKNRKKGLLFENQSGETPFYKVYNNNRSLFEMILGASHGSADSYVTSQQFEERIKSSHHHIHSRVQGDCSDILVLVLDLPRERELYNTVIRDIQDNIFANFCSLTNTFIQTNCTVPDAEWFARNHAKMVFTPTRSMIDLFARLYHLENFGIFTYTNFETVDKMSVRSRLRNIRNIFRNPAILESGIWPPIILRRLGLGSLQAFDGRRRFYKEFSTIR